MCRSGMWHALGPIQRGGHGKVNRSAMTVLGSLEGDKSIKPGVVCRGSIIATGEHLA